MRNVGLVLVLGGVVAAGCGGSDAKGKCNTLVTSYCSRVVSCAVQGEALADGFSAQDLGDNCHDVLLESARCEDAVRVSSSYGTCLSEVKALDCDESNSSLINDMTFSLPDSCSQVVLYQK